MMGWDSAHWHWPQVVCLTITAVNLCSTALLNGDDRTGKYSFPVTLCSAALSLWILWSGGFFA